MAAANVQSRVSDRNMLGNLDRAIVVDYPTLNSGAIEYQKVTDPNCDRPIVEQLVTVQRGGSGNVDHACVDDLACRTVSADTCITR